ncbi:unnamed protein product [Withania somnifera]
MYAKQKKLRPRLDRRNALKNVDYDASQSVSSSRSLFEDQSSHRTRSLDLYPLTNRTSFRINGAAGEFDTICSSLGLSPEDFAIPVASWEAGKPCSRSDRLRSIRYADNRRDSNFEFEDADELSDSVGNSVRVSIDAESNRRFSNLTASESNEETDLYSYENELETADEVYDSVRKGARGIVGDKLKHNLNSSPENGIKDRVSEPEDDNLPTDVKCGIKGSRPPRLAPLASDVYNFTSAWDFIRSFGPADSENVESTSNDILGKEQLGEIAGNEEPSEDFVRNASQVSESSSEISTDNDSSVLRTGNDGVLEKPFEQGVRDAAESSNESSKSPSDGSYSLMSKKSSKSPTGESHSVISETSSNSPSDDSYSLISKTSSKSPTGESYGVISEMSSKSQGDESYILSLKTVRSVSPNGSPSIKSWQKGDFLGSGSFGTVYEGFTEDIKCANILVDVNGSVKLADFGLAKATQMNNIKSCKGTAFWMAPEVVNRKNNGYGIPADIWSLGCTILEMLTGQIPYSHLEGMQALFRIGRGEPPPIPDTLSTEAQDFIKSCLRVNPSDRPTAAELLEHPFIMKSSNFSSPSAP